jgi:hypothetical protein
MDYGTVSHFLAYTLMVITAVLFIAAVVDLLFETDEWDD